MNPYPKIYHVEKRNTVLIVAGVSLLLALIWILHFSIDFFSGKTIGWDYGIGTLVLVLALVSIPLFVRYWLENAKLIVSEEGLSCEDISSFIGFSTSWHNIRAIGEAKSYLLLVLSSPSTPITKIGEWALKHPATLTRPDVINISSFLEQWRSGELRKDFEKYAPHLFQDESQVK